MQTGKNDFEVWFQEGVINIDELPTPTGTWDDVDFSWLDNACAPIWSNATLGPAEHLDDLSSQLIEPIITEDKDSHGDSGVSSFSPDGQQPDEYSGSRDGHCDSELQLVDEDLSSRRLAHNDRKAIESPGSQATLLQATGGDFPSQFSLSQGSPFTNNADRNNMRGRRSRTNSRSATTNPIELKAIHLAKKNPNFRVEPYDRTLNHRLHLAMLESRSRANNKQEAARGFAAGPAGSSSLGFHLGDLVVANSMRKETRKHAKQIQLIANPRQSRRYKADGFEEEDGLDNGDREQIHASGDERVKLHRRPLPQLITSSPNMSLSTTQQSESDRLQGGPSRPILPLDENRKCILPTADGLRPAQTTHRQIDYIQQGHQPSIAQPQATLPTSTSQADHPIQKANRGGQTRKRSSDEACNDDPDIVNRPSKKTKQDSDTSMTQHPYLKQAHQVQAWQKQANLHLIPPPVIMSQAPVARHQMVPAPFQPFPTQGPWAGKKRTAEDAILEGTSNHMQDCRQPKRLKETHIPAVSSTQGNLLPPQHFGMQYRPGTMMSSNLHHPLQQQRLSRPQRLYFPPQHLPQNPQQSFDPRKSPPYGYRQQQKPPNPRPPPTYHQTPKQTPEQLRKIHEEYQEYVRKTRSRRPPSTPKTIHKPISKPPPKSRKPKGPARILGSDGKLVKIKRSTGKFEDKLDGLSPQELCRLQRLQRLLFEGKEEEEEEDGEMDEEELLANEDLAMRLLQEEIEAEKEAERVANHVELLREKAETERVEVIRDEAEKERKEVRRVAEQEEQEAQSVKEQEDPAEAERRIRVMNEQCFSEWTYDDREEIQEIQERRW